MESHVGKTVSIQLGQGGQWLAGQGFSDVHLSPVQDSSTTSWTVEKDPTHYTCYSFRHQDGHYLAGDGRMPQSRQVYLLNGKFHPATTWVCTDAGNGKVYMQVYQEQGQYFSTNIWLTGQVNAVQSNQVYLTPNYGSIDSQCMVVESYGGPQPTPWPQPNPQPTPQPTPWPQPTPQPTPQPGRSFTYNEIEVKLRQTFPSLQNVQLAPLADPSYRSLDLPTMQSIWRNSFMGKGTPLYSLNNFDCDDFAYCMKAEVSHYSQKNPGPAQPGGQKDGYLCGVFYSTATTGNAAHAYNFYITASGEIKLFEPQSGTEMNSGYWRPYFAMF